MNTQPNNTNDPHLKKLEKAAKDYYSRVDPDSHFKENLDKIVTNAIDYKIASRHNGKQQPVEQKQKPRNFLSLLLHGAKWQVAFLASFAAIFLISGVTLAAVPQWRESISEIVKPTKGYLYVKSNPDGARVYVATANSEDFKDEGVTPVRIKLIEGTYDVKLTKEGYENFVKEDVEIKAGEEESYEFALAEEEDPYKGWQKYTNSNFGFEFEYPANWTHKEGPVFDDEQTTMVTGGKPTQQIEIFSEDEKTKILFDVNPSGGDICDEPEELEVDKEKKQFCKNTEEGKTIIYGEDLTSSESETTVRVSLSVDIDAELAEAEEVFVKVLESFEFKKSAQTYPTNIIPTDEKKEPLLVYKKIHGGTANRTIEVGVSYGTGDEQLLDPIFTFKPANSDDAPVALSNDGKRIAYVDEAGVKIYEIESNDSYLINPLQTNYLIWSPSGEYLMVEDDNKWALLEAKAQGNLSKIKDNESREVESYSPSWIAWHPDSKYLIVLINRDERARIFVSNEIQSISDVTLYPLTPEVDYYIGSISLSPTGEYLLAQRNHTQDQILTDLEILRINPRERKVIEKTKIATYYTQTVYDNDEQEERILGSPTWLSTTNGEKVFYQTNINSLTHNGYEEVFYLYDVGSRDLSKINIENNISEWSKLESVIRTNGEGKVELQFEGGISLSEDKADTRRFVMTLDIDSNEAALKELPSLRNMTEVVGNFKSNYLTHD